jgi:hypothetical protein
MSKTIIISTILVVLTGVGGFFAGTKYQASQRPNFASFRGGDGNQFQRGTGGNRSGFRPVAGSIISSTDTSITVQIAGGGSKIVLLTDKTEINQATTATKADLKTGTAVAVFGTDNSDGSVTAQSVQINPMFRGQPTPTP